MVSDRCILQAKREYVGLPAVNALLAGGVVPWSLAFSQRLGRHVIATRDIQPGAPRAANAGK